MGYVLNMKNDRVGSSVRIDRRTRWGNPFKLGRDGTRDEVIEKYRKWLWAAIYTGEIKQTDLAALHGKRVACWCAPKACHGDVLTRAATWAHNDIDNYNRKGTT